MVGTEQFAYLKEHGSRDVLALCVSDWITAFVHFCKISLYCSDVAGAFDRVKTSRLITKLINLGFHPDLVRVLASWLHMRKAAVLVSGICSEEFALEDMVFFSRHRIGTHLMGYVLLRRGDGNPSS